MLAQQGYDFECVITLEYDPPHGKREVLQAPDQLILELQIKAP